MLGCRFPAERTAASTAANEKFPALVAKAAANRGEPDDGSRYYHYWLAVLERLVTAKGLADPEALLARKEAWAEAYRLTPHGKPVQLGAVPAGTEHS